LARVRGKGNVKLRKRGNTDIGLRSIVGTAAMGNGRYTTPRRTIRKMSGKREENNNTERRTI